MFSLFSSDHCPFRYDDPKGKLVPKGRTSFRWVPNGIPGVETRLPILFSEGVGKGRNQRVGGVGFAQALGDPPVVVAVAVDDELLPDLSLPHTGLPQHLDPGGFRSPVGCRGPVPRLTVEVGEHRGRDADHHDQNRNRGGEPGLERGRGP